MKKKSLLQNHQKSQSSGYGSLQKREKESLEILKELLGKKRTKELLEGEPLRLKRSGRKIELNHEGQLKDVETDRRIDVPLSWRRKENNRILAIYIALGGDKNQRKVYSTLRAGAEILPEKDIEKMATRKLELLNRRDYLRKLEEKLEKKLEQDNYDDKDQCTGVPGEGLEEKLSFVKAELEILKESLQKTPV